MLRSWGARSASLLRMRTILSISLVENVLHQ